MRDRYQEPNAKINFVGFPQQKCIKGFPDGPVVKNLPESEGDMCSISGPGRSHMPGSNETHAPQLLKPALPGSTLCNKRSHYNEKSTHHN